jgi:hypothetical protein
VNAGRRATKWLLRVARRILPASQGEWADAMEAEAAAISDDYEALRWAIGCVLASEAMQLWALLRRPSAFVPLMMSLAAITMVLVHAALFGIVHEPDEGTPAHVFQLLMMAQLPIIAIFILRRVTSAPRATIEIVGLQIVAAGCAVLSVLLLT